MYYKVIVTIVIGFLGLSMYAMQKDNIRRGLIHYANSALQQRLFAAVEKGDSKAVEIVLEQDIGAHAQNEHRNTLLLLAAGSGHKEVVVLLLDKGADINAKNVFNETTLHYAASRGHKEVVAFLLDKGANIHAQDLDGSSSLLKATQNGYKEIVVLLLDRGATVNAQNQEGDTPLHRAAFNGHKEIMAFLLNKDANINAQDKQGKTALHLAAQNGHKEVAALLLARGAHSNTGDKNGYTPLMSAAYNGDKEIVALLLDSGATISAKDVAYSALDLAVMGGANKEVITLLLDRITAQNSDYCNTLLHMVAYNGHKEVIALLLANGADVNAKDSEGYTGFQIAMREGHKEVSQLLELCLCSKVQEYLKNPQDFVNKHGIDFIFDQKQTVLMLACIFGHTHIISLFKDYSVEFINAQDEYGRCALDYALLFNLDSSAHLIHTFGTKLRMSSSHITTLMEQGVKKGNLTLVNALLSIGAKPTLELAQQAREGGYLKVMHRLLFSYLADPDNKCHPQVAFLSELFKS